MGGGRRGSARGESMVAKEQEKRKIESVSGQWLDGTGSITYGRQINHCVAQVPCCASWLGMDSLCPWYFLFFILISL